MQNVIDGKLMYLKMVKGDEDSVYTRLYSKFQSLIQRDTSSEKTNSYGISYVETTTVSKFEQINKTTINFVKMETENVTLNLLWAEKNNMPLL